MPRLQGSARRITESGAFAWSIMAVITVNAVVLGMQTYPGIEREHGALLDALNDVCLTIFVLELVIRFVAHGRRPQDFFRSGWNVFDFVVIMGAFAPGLRENSTLLRLVRLARIVRIVRLLPDLRVLIVAIGRTLPGMMSLIVLGAMTLYVYGMVGWLLFGDDDAERYGTIGDAMLTLFVLLSLEGLPEILADGMGTTSWAVPFYVSFVLISGLLLLNILIGIVINSMEQAHQIEWAREVAERRRRAAITEDDRDDLELDVLDRVGALRQALDELERDLMHGRPAPVQRWRR